MTQEAKERFRLRANLEERIAGRQLAAGSLFVSSFIPMLYQNVYMLTFSFLGGVVCLPFFKVPSSSLH